MSKSMGQFMSELQKQSKKLPEEEAEALLSFYGDLLENAEDVEETIGTLPEPKKIVQNLLKKSTLPEEIPLEKGSDEWNAQVQSMKKQIVFMAVFVSVLVFLKDCVEYVLYINSYTGEEISYEFYYIFLAVPVLSLIVGGVSLHFALEKGKVIALQPIFLKKLGVFCGGMVVFFYLLLNVFPWVGIQVSNLCFDRGWEFLGTLLWSIFLPAYFVVGFMPYLCGIMPILNFIHWKRET